jgi:hypothetical protein
MLAYLRASADLMLRLGAVPLEPGLYGRPHGRVGIAISPHGTCFRLGTEMATRDKERAVTSMVAKGAQQHVETGGPDALFWPLVAGAEDR